MPVVTFFTTIWADPKPPILLLLHCFQKVLTYLQIKLKKKEFELSIVNVTQCSAELRIKPPGLFLHNSTLKRNGFKDRNFLLSTK